MADSNLRARSRLQPNDSSDDDDYYSNHLRNDPTRLTDKNRTISYACPCIFFVLTIVIFLATVPLGSVSLGNSKLAQAIRDNAKSPPDGPRTKIKVTDTGLLDDIENIDVYKRQAEQAARLERASRIEGYHTVWFHLDEKGDRVDGLPNLMTAGSSIQVAFQVLHKTGRIRVGTEKVAVFLRGGEEETFPHEDLSTQSPDTQSIEHSSSTSLSQPGKLEAKVLNGIKAGERCQNCFVVSANVKSSGPRSLFVTLDGVLLTTSVEQVLISPGAPEPALSSVVGQPTTHTKPGVPLSVSFVVMDAFANRVDVDETAIHARIVGTNGVYPVDVSVGRGGTGKASAVLMEPGRYELSLYVNVAFSHGDVPIFREIEGSPLSVEVSASETRSGLLFASRTPCTMDGLVGEGFWACNECIKRVGKRYIEPAKPDFAWAPTKCSLEPSGCLCNNHKTVIVGASGSMLHTVVRNLLSVCDGAEEHISKIVNSQHGASAKLKSSMWTVLKTDSSAGAVGDTIARYFEGDDSGPVNVVVIGDFGNDCEKTHEEATAGARSLFLALQHVLVQQALYITPPPELYRDAIDVGGLRMGRRCRSEWESYVSHLASQIGCLVVEARKMMATHVITSTGQVPEAIPGYLGRNVATIVQHMFCKK